MTLSAQSGLNVNNGTAVFGGGEGFLTVGPEDFGHIAIDHTDIQRKNGSGYNTLFLNYFGGDVSLVGLNNGKVGIATSIPQATLHVQRGVDASLSTHGYMVLGSTSGLNIVIDDNEIMARNNGAASPLYLNNNGGAVYAKGILGIGDQKNMQFNSTTGEIGWDNSSRRYKIKIQTLDDDWSKIFSARPVKYTRPRSPDRWEYGYIAEEMDSIGLTNLVGYDAEGIPDDVKYDRMVIYLTEVLKMHHQDIQELKKQKETIVSLMTRMQKQEIQLKEMQSKMSKSLAVNLPKQLD